MSVAAGSVRFTHNRESLALKQPIRAQAHFGADGLEGSILYANQLGEIDDAIIRSPSAPSSEVNIDRVGNFQVKPDDLLAEGEFITGTMLDNNQQQRQAIYREVLGAEHGSLLPQVTTLFAWGENDQLGFNQPASFQKTGSTLFPVPLEFNRTPAQRPFLIPATFIRAANADAGVGQSMLFDSASGTWAQDINYRSESMLRFVIPDSVIPCRIKTAELTLKIQAPSRTLKILGMQDGKRTVLETRRSPSGIIHLKIDDPKLLKLDENGGLQFGFQVSQTHKQIEAVENAAEQAKQSAAVKIRDPQKGKTSPASGSVQIAAWQVDYMRLQVTGVTDRALCKLDALQIKHFADQAILQLDF